MSARFSFVKRAMAVKGTEITIRHFTKIAYDQNDQIDIASSTYTDTITSAVMIFPTPAKFPRGAGRPGMGEAMQMLPEGTLTRDDYGAFIESDETVEADDHVIFSGGTLRIITKRPTMPDLGLAFLILRKIVGGV